MRSTVSSVHKYIVGGIFLAVFFLSTAPASSAPNDCRGKIIAAEGSTILRDPRPGVPIDPKRHLDFNETFTIKTCRIRGEKLIDGSRRVYCKIFFKSDPPAEGFIPASDLVVTRASVSQEICKIKGQPPVIAGNTKEPGQKPEEIKVISKFRRQMMSVLAKEFDNRFYKEINERSDGRKYFAKRTIES